MLRSLHRYSLVALMALVLLSFTACDPDVEIVEVEVPATPAAGSREAKGKGSRRTQFNKHPPLCGRSPANEPYLLSKVGPKVLYHCRRGRVGAENLYPRLLWSPGGWTLSKSG